MTGMRTKRGRRKAARPRAACRAQPGSGAGRGRCEHGEWYVSAPPGGRDPASIRAIPPARDSRHSRTARRFLLCGIRGEFRGPQPRSLDMNTAEMRVLIDAEIEQTSGAAPNLGGYIYCNEPR